jgi:hypothetical protein
MTQIYVPLLDEGTDVWRPTPLNTSEKTFIGSRANPQKMNGGGFHPGSSFVVVSRIYPVAAVLSHMRVQPSDRAMRLTSFLV